ncbi:MAG: Crp/Fnr family transcriptional regulator [Acidobacteria bacterium]|nr:Crp/Fnr family transcriptional regulator [Acidobacteriota bacterium]
MLAPPELRLLDEAKVHNVYAAGQVIFYQGNPCLGLHCLESGVVALRKVDERGNSVIVRLGHAGDTLGYVAFFAQRLYSTSAECLGECRTCFIDRAALRELLGRNPALGQRFLGRLAANLEQAEELRLEAAASPLLARLAQLLLTLKNRLGAVADDGTLGINLPLSRRDLAAMLGARPETISRAIAQLERRGLAHFTGRRVTIPDLDALIDEAEQVPDCG